MTEGLPPGIPEHLKEGLPGADKYEEDARRQYQIANKRWLLQIPEQSFEANETVRRYVTTARDVDAQIERLSGHGRPKHGRAATQFFRAKLLYGVERQILENDLWGKLDLIELEEDLNQVAGDYGVQVVLPDRWTQIPDNYLRRNEPTGIWTPTRYHDARPEPPWELWKGRRGSTGWYWADLGFERHDAEHVKTLQAEAEKQGIPDEPEWFAPETHELLTALHAGRELVAATEHLATLPPAPGLSPSANDRLAQVAPLNRLAVALLEDVHQPGPLNSEQVAAELARTVGPYELLIKRDGRPRR